jgi:hypothetical protein
MYALAFMLARDLRRLRFKPAVMGVSLPQYTPVIHRLRPKKRFYYCVDDYRYYWPDRAAATQELEDRLVQEVDLVLCTARFMKDELSRRVPSAAH